MAGTSPATTERERLFSRVDLERFPIKSKYRHRHASLAMTTMGFKRLGTGSRLAVVGRPVLDDTAKPRKTLRAAGLKVIGRESCREIKAADA
jgi:hypothetical protein